MTIVKIDHAGLTDILPEGGFVAGKMYGIADKCRGVVFDKDKVVDVTELLC